MVKLLQKNRVTIQMVNTVIYYSCDIFVDNLLKCCLYACKFRENEIKGQKTNVRPHRAI